MLRPLVLTVFAWGLITACIEHATITRRQTHHILEENDVFTSKNLNNNTRLQGVSPRTEELIYKLRLEGKRHLRNGNVEVAADCYAAIIQNLEGLGGLAAGDLMRKCGITLAECEVKLGNLFDAIARCTDVINELPEDENTTTNDRIILGKLYYRRAISFQRLDMKHYAYLDMLKASQYIQSDNKINNAIQYLHIDFYNDTYNNNAIHKTLMQEELQDAVAEASFKFPVREFSVKEMMSLAGMTQPSTFMRGFKKPNKIASSSVPFSLSNIFPGASDGNGIGDLGKLSGVFSDIMEPSNMKNYIEMFNAVSWFGKWVYTIVTILTKNNHIALIVLTICWCIRILMW